MRRTFHSGLWCAFLCLVFVRFWLVFSWLLFFVVLDFEWFFSVGGFLRCLGEGVFVSCLFFRCLSIFEWFRLYYG